MSPNSRLIGESYGRVHDALSLSFSCHGAAPQDAADLAGSMQDPFTCSAFSLVSVFVQTQYFIQKTCPARPKGRLSPFLDTGRPSAQPQI